MIKPIILCVFGGTLLTLAVRSLRAHRLKEAYVLLFIAVGVPFVLLAIWPYAIDKLAVWLEIEKPTVLVLMLTAFVTLMLFKLLSIVSVQDQKIRTLTQLVGILAEKNDLTRPMDDRSEAARPTNPEASE